MAITIAQASTLSTTRLVLRPCNPQSRDDTTLILRTYNDPFIGRFGFASVGLRTHEDVVRKHYQQGPCNRPQACTRWMSEYGEVADVMYHLIYLKNDMGGPGEYIGFAGNIFRTEVEMGPDFGYAIFENFCGKGYASEAGAAALKWWQEEAGVKEIWLGTFDDNIASQKCAKRIGFVEGGEIRMVGGSKQTWFRTDLLTSYSESNLLRKVSPYFS